MTLSTRRSRHLPLSRHPLPAALTLGVLLAVAACSGTSPSSSSLADAGPSREAAGCFSDSQCSALLPTTDPADCATAKCLSGACVFAAKDVDGDGHPTAHCEALDGPAVIQAGDDCNDHDPTLYPGHAEPCALTTDGKAPPGTLCAMGSRSCLADGAESSCEGTVACVDASCVGGTCEITCTAGQLGCGNDAQPQTCVGGQWRSSGAACVDQACVAGACVGACTPGTIDCADATTPETCDASGAWQKQAACLDEACNAGECLGTCTPGAVSCADGATPETCDAHGNWQPNTACTGATPACLAGACVACAPGATNLCLDDITPELCDATGAWQPRAACVNQACSEGACMGTCTPGATDGCFDATTRATCDATGTWQAAAACIDQACNAGQCEGVCAPGAGQCVGTARLGQQPQTCDATGQWANAGAACADFCSNGVCGVGTVATGQTGVTRMAADGTNVYWASLTSGTIVKAAAAGGDATTIVASRNPVEIGVDSQDVYWTEDATPGTVLKAPLTGGAVTTLASGLTYPSGIAVAGGSVFFVDDQNKIKKVPTAGGVVTTLVSSSPGSLAELAVDSTNVYWTDTLADTVMKVPVGGGTPVTLAIDPMGPSAITAAAGYVYWVNSAQVAYVPSAGGAVQIVASGLPWPAQIIVNSEDFLFWTNAGTAAGHFMDGSVEDYGQDIIAAGQYNPHAIALGGTFVYWSDAGSGTIMISYQQ